jgi:hypothetical protein
VYKNRDPENFKCRGCIDAGKQAKIDAVKMRPCRGKCKMMKEHTKFGQYAGGSYKASCLECEEKLDKTRCIDAGKQAKCVDCKEIKEKSEFPKTDKDELFKYCALCDKKRNECACCGIRATRRNQPEHLVDGRWYPQIYLVETPKTHPHPPGQTDRQTDRQTDGRQKDSQTANRQTDRQTDRQTHRQTHRQTEADR